MTSAVKEVKGFCDGDSVFRHLVREGLPEEVTLELRPESERSPICENVGKLPFRQREQQAQRPQGGSVLATSQEQWRPVWLDRSERNSR